MSLGGHERVAVDTSPLVYFLGDDPRRSAPVRALLDRAMRQRVSLVLSAISVLELLVKPLRERDDRGAQIIRTLVYDPLRFTIVDLAPEVAEIAASIRAETRLSVADAAVVASGLARGCTALLGNDAQFRRLGDRMEYVHLDDIAVP